MLSIFSFSSIHAEITWNLSSSGILTISGTDMPDFDDSDYAPWYSQRDKIKKVVIENGVTNIGNYAFIDCSITTVTIPNSVTSIGEKAFLCCSGLTSITISNSVKSIGEKVFKECESLSSITIPNSVTSIGDEAFSGCSGLISITIGNSVTSIGESAFEGCFRLNSITIPESVTSIGQHAFYRCYALTSITIPNSVMSLGYSAFDGTEWYGNQPDGLVYSGHFLYKYKGTMPANTKIYVKEGTLGIADGAFVDCIGLTSITIPNSVKSIGNSAFIIVFRDP